MFKSKSISRSMCSLVVFDPRRVMWCFSRKLGPYHRLPWNFRKCSAALILQKNTFLLWNTFRDHSMSKHNSNTRCKSSRKIKLLKSTQVLQKLKFQYLNSLKTSTQKMRFDVCSLHEHVERTLASIPQMSLLLKPSNVQVHKRPEYNICN
jgi:hypothetical protein